MRADLVMSACKVISTVRPAQNDLVCSRRAFQLTLDDMILVEIPIEGWVLTGSLATSEVPGGCMGCGGKPDTESR